MNRAENGGNLRIIKRGTVFKLAAFAGVLVSFLLLLLESQRNHFGFSVGPSLPPGKVAPQLVSAVDVGVLLAPDGSLWCWGGTGPAKRGLGLVEEPTEVPQRIGSSADWCRLAASFSHALALKSDGSLWGWGWNGYGVATQAHAKERVSEPTRIGSDTSWTQIAVGAGHCLALKSDGSLWAWGQNDHGQVGDGSTNNQFTATQIGSDHDWGAIAAGAFSSFALKKNGTLWGWGYLMYQSPDALAPQQIDAGSNVVAISANEFCLFALRSDGTLWICGQNAPATASASATAATRTLVQIGKKHDWKEVYAGTRFFFARKRNGSWWVCGALDTGSGPSLSLASPKRLPLSFEPWSLAPGLGNALLLTKDGTLWTLSIRPDTSKFAVGLTKLKVLLNQLLGRLPWRPQPFDPKEFRITPTPQKLWELPGEAPFRSAQTSRIERMVS
jgi:hypothetical protein